MIALAPGGYDYGAPLELGPVRTRCFCTRALLLLLVLAAAGCRSDRPMHGVAGAMDASELEVVVSFLAQEYDSYVRSNGPLVIEDTLSIATLYRGTESHKDFKKSLLSGASRRVSSDLVRDFCAKNTKPQRVWPTLSKSLPIVLISRQELESMFSAKRDEKPDGWDRFYSKYPHSPGIITISRVGFNRRGDMAMVYVGSQSHWLAGEGSIHVLRKKDGKWVEELLFFGPHWIS